MRSFSRDEADIFFGRESLVHQILERLGRAHSITIAGNSGCGKSSLVRAGLLPFLDDPNNFPGTARRRTVLFTPGKEPLRRLNEAITEHANTSQQALTTPASPSLILEYLSTMFRASGDDWLLIIDQFEEIFRALQSPASNEEFKLFVSALNDIGAGLWPNVYVILVMRPDFIGDCGYFAGLTELVNRGLVLVPPLSREGRLAAIIKPVEKVGGAADIEFAKRLVDDVDDDPDGLVLMQHLLQRMWVRERHVHQSSAPTLTLAGYAAVGELSHALRLHAEEVFSALASDEARQLASRVFKCLTSNERGRLSRRPARLAELETVLQAKIDQLVTAIMPFAQAGFLIPQQLSGWTDNTVIDIRHEAVIRQWPRLMDWIEQEAESGEMYARLRASAQRHSQAMGAFLAEPELSYVRAWFAQQEPSRQWAERYGGDYELTVAYLRESEAAGLKREGKILQKPGGVFICYRRDDSAGDARNISDKLASRFGSHRIFMDVDSISLGSNFEDVLLSTLHSCSVVLVLIGPHWLMMADGEGHRRLDNSSDYVRIEIRDAMSHELRVVPVLLGRATMPEESQLPSDIRRLSKLQSVSLKHETFTTDLQELAMKIQQYVGSDGLSSQIRQGLTKALQWTRFVSRR